jgi:hypothetical protein
MDKVQKPIHSEDQSVFEFLFSTWQKKRGGVCLWVLHDLLTSADHHFIDAGVSFLLLYKGSGKTGDRYLEVIGVAPLVTGFRMAARDRIYKWVVVVVVFLCQYWLATGWQSGEGGQAPLCGICRVSCQYSYCLFCLWPGPSEFDYSRRDKVILYCGYYS